MDYSMFEPYAIKLAVMVGLMFADMLGGILVALLVNKNFQWEKVPSFLKTYVPYLFGWLVFAALDFIPTEYSDMLKKVLQYGETGVYTAIMLGVGGSLFGHLAKLGVFTNGFAKLGVGDGTSRKDVG